MSGNMRKQLADRFSTMEDHKDLLRIINEMGEEAVALALPVIELIATNRLPTSPGTLRDLQLGLMRVSSDMKLASQCVESAKKAAQEASDILSRLEVYSRVSTSDEEIEKWSDAFDILIWRMSSSDEELRALRVQIESSVTKIKKILPL